MAGTVSFGGGGTGYYGQAWAGKNSQESYIRAWVGGYPTGNLNSDGGRPVSIDSVSITGASGFNRYTYSSDGYVYLYFGPQVRVTLNSYKNNNSHMYDSWSGSYFYMGEWPYSPLGLDGSYSWSTVPSKVQNLSIGRSQDGSRVTGNFAGPADSGGRTVDYYRVYTSENGASWVHRGDGYQNGVIDLPATKTSSYRILVYAHNSLGFSEGVETGTIYGAPSKPAAPSATRDTVTAGKINVSWTAPSSSLSILEYAVDRYSENGATYLARIYSGGTATSAPDVNRPRGEKYTYRVYARNSTGWSDISDATPVAVMSPGVPSKPAKPSLFSKVGRNVVISSARGSTDYGNSITEYRIQLSTDGGTTWKGWNNDTKSFSANNSYNVLDSNGRFSYQLLTPALTYVWRVFAVNSIGAGDLSDSSDALFVSAGGRRWTGSAFNPTENAKRWTGSGWTDIVVAKRWTGSGWADLT